MIDDADLEGDDWDPVRRLLAHVDDQLAEVRRRHGMDYLRPRYTRPLLLLSHHGPQTIRALAGLAQVTHSAMSQSVMAMRADQLVTSEPGPDARTRLVTLTRRGIDAIPFLRSECLAKRKIVRGLEKEAGLPLTRAVEAVTTLLDDRAFASRVDAELDRMSKKSGGLR